MEKKEKTLLDLPKNVVLLILSFSQLKELFQFSLISKRANSLFKEDFLWKQLCFRDKITEEKTEETWLQTVY